MCRHAHLADGEALDTYEAANHWHGDRTPTRDDHRLPPKVVRTLEPMEKAMQRPVDGFGGRCEQEMADARRLKS